MEQTTPGTPWPKDAKARIVRLRDPDAADPAIRALVGKLVVIKKWSYSGKYIAEHIDVRVPEAPHLGVLSFYPDELRLGEEPLPAPPPVLGLAMSHERRAALRATLEDDVRNGNLTIRIGPRQLLWLLDQVDAHEEGQGA
jgi:hypothetical protein